MKTINQLKEFLKNKKIPLRLIFIITGIASTVWFLIRVIPKPQRAAYPCMKAAAPIMSSFVIYIISMSGIVLAFRQSKKKFFQAKYLAAGAFLIASVVGVYFYMSYSAMYSIAARPDGVNNPMGTGIGIKPGRVVWAWNPNATNENCTHTGPTNAVCSGTDSTLMWPSETNSDYYFLKKNNNQAAIDSMINESLKSLADTNDVSGAWDKLFVDFNNKKGKGKVGYKATEKIFIKINMGGIWFGANKDPHLNPNPVGYTGCWSTMDGNLNRFFSSQNVVNSNPFAILSVIKTLVDAGVPENMIYVGDPMKQVYQDMYEYWKASYPNINVLGNNFNFTGIYDVTSNGRVEAKATTTDKIYYSDKGTALTTTSDKLFTIFEEADYMINMSVLKAHESACVTLCAKNHFGSQAQKGASHLHKGLLSTGVDNQDRAGYGKYRVQVDLMGHKLLGGNTILFIVDGTWAHENGYDEKALKKWRKAPFNNDYPSSIFISQDGVAIESVCLDFLAYEYDGKDGRTNRPNYTGSDDYLHQAASKTNWPSSIIYDPENDASEISSLGVHEHWNDPLKRQYSRNIDSINGKGIELVGVLKAKSEVSTEPGVLLLQNNSVNDYKIFPNPVSEKLNVTYTLESDCYVELEIIDLNGKSISKILSQKQSSGNYSEQWTAKVPSGIYICRITTIDAKNKNSHSKQFQVIK